MVVVMQHSLWEHGLRKLDLFNLEKAERRSLWCIHLHFGDVQEELSHMFYWMCIAKGEKFQLDIWRKFNGSTGCSGGGISMLRDTQHLGWARPWETWSNLEISYALSSNSSSTLAFGIPFPWSSPITYGKTIAFSGHKHLCMPGFIASQSREHT